MVPTKWTVKLQTRAELLLKEIKQTLLITLWNSLLKNIVLLSDLHVPILKHLM